MSLTAAEHRQRTILAWTEKHFQQQVVGLAKTLGWWTHHHYDARRSTPGWPDLVMLRGDRALFVELKAEKGRVSPAQQEVIARLTEAGLNAQLWRPRDYLSGRVQQELAQHAHNTAQDAPAA